MAKIGIIVLLGRKHLFINLAKLLIFNIFVWITNEDNLLVKFSATLKYVLV